MGFLDVFMLWSIFIIVTAFILFVVFSYFLGWFNQPVTLPDTTHTTVSRIEPLYVEDDITEETYQQRRKLVGLFILVAIITIMVTSSINMFINTTNL